MPTTQNKLTPLLVVIAAVIVGYVMWARFTTPSPSSSSGTPVTAARPAGKASGAMPPDALGGAAPLPATRSADADTPADTLATVAQTNRDLRAAAQKVLEDNERLKRENVQLQRASDAMADRVREQVLAELAHRTPAPAAPSPGGLLDNGMDAANKLINGIAGKQATPGGVPPGLGFDGAAVPAVPRAAPPEATGLTKTIAPVGYRVKQGPDGGPVLERNALLPQQGTADLTQSLAQGAPMSEKPLPEPYFTIPENATLARSTAMTMLVGRVPIDGRVQDPMQFKLVIGRENLAASGQYVPDDVSGIIVSGIAIGDMALSCTEGWVQSMTFVFDDGTIRTVSMRRNGASATSAGSGGGVALASTPKLGSLSDEFGNPCIPGQFVTNAPAYLADIVGAKSLSVAGAAIAAAQTTTTTGASALGSSTSTTVTGDKGRYILGQAASAGSDEIVRWLMQRLNNSFDAVVVRAGTRVVVHIDQPIEIDKEPDGRRLDHRRGRAMTAQQGGRHGLD
ncbi:MAG TPA: TIGR03752 family integrating conjugative element protein [Aquabacterium sp.]|nr:TIGR03752 family integrating conjugative element protein [Aquabacterium sp.]